MSYEEEGSRRSRVVVETPTAHREISQTETVRTPERNGVSGTTVGVIVVLAVALITVLVLFFMSSQQTDTANENLQAQQTPPQTTIVQQPAAQQPPVIIQQAPSAPQQPPIVVTQPAPSGGSSSGSNDLDVQSAVDKRIADDPTFSTLGVTVTVIDGKATINGVLKTDALKAQLERLVRGVRGVKEIDNQIQVSG